MSTAAPSASEPLSRRARQRRATVEEIKTLARQQLAETGPGALSLRAIARQMGTASSALYRYFASSNELISALCVDAYDSITAAVSAARDAHPAGDPARQWWAIGHAARRWSLEHPADYALIFGTPIPGYQAPAEVTGPAAGRFAAVPGATYAVAVDTGVADPQRSEVPRDIPAGDGWSKLLVGALPDYPPQLAGILLNAAASLVGYFMAETLGSLRHLIGDPDALFDAHLRTVMAGMGFDPDKIPAPTASRD
jgi:AcrR family transcriptional regulator